MAADQGPYCAQCCFHEDCGPCGNATTAGATPTPAIRKAASADWGCAEQCCIDEDCGACGVCYQGICRSQCEGDDICCDDGRGGYCASPREGCCGVFGDWCEPVTITEGNLNGSCVKGCVAVSMTRPRAQPALSAAGTRIAQRTGSAAADTAPSAATTRAASEASASKGSASSVAITGIAARVKSAAKDSATRANAREP